jgi:hypothetical protein
MTAIFLSLGTLLIGALVGYEMAVHPDLAPYIAAGAAVCYTIGAAFWWRDRHRPVSKAPLRLPSGGIQIVAGTATLTSRMRRRLGLRAPLARHRFVPDGHGKWFECACGWRGWTAPEMDAHLMEQWSPRRDQ